MITDYSTVARTVKKLSIHYSLNAIQVYLYHSVQFTGIADDSGQATMSALGINTPALNVCISSLHAPATHAVIKHAMHPASSARTATRANTADFCGHMPVMMPSCMPIEPMFEKPHNA